MAGRKSSRNSQKRHGSGSGSTPKAWSREEHDTLRDGVAHLGPKRWRMIEEEFFLGTRTADACHARWVELTRHGQSAEKHKWSPQEDRRLAELAAQYNGENWSLVASQLSGRNAKQCRERWQNQLRPDLKRDQWTSEEDAVIVAWQAQVGNKWATIATKLPGRTDNMVKNRWYSTLSREIQLPATPANRAANAKPKAAVVAVGPQPQRPSARTVAVKPKNKRQKLFGTSSKKKKKKQRNDKLPVEQRAQSPDTVEAVVDEEQAENPWVLAIPESVGTADVPLDDECARSRFLLEKTHPLMELSVPHDAGDDDDWLPDDVDLAAIASLEALDVSTVDEDDLLVDLDAGGLEVAAGWKEVVM